jgi:hypothetical protein
MRVVSKKKMSTSTVPISNGNSLRVSNVYFFFLSLTDRFFSSRSNPLTLNPLLEITVGKEEDSDTDELREDEEQVYDEARTPEYEPSYYPSNCPREITIDDITNFYSKQGQEIELLKKKVTEKEVLTGKLFANNVTLNKEIKRTNLQISKLLKTLSVRQRDINGLNDMVKADRKKLKDEQEKSLHQHITTVKKCNVCFGVKKLTVILLCFHQTCQSCIERLFITAPRCPICRDDIRATCDTEGNFLNSFDYYDVESPVYTPLQ